jgi:hypothetical protein
LKSDLSKESEGEGEEGVVEGREECDAISHVTEPRDNPYPLPSVVINYPVLYSVPQEGVSGGEGGGERDNNKKIHSREALFIRITSPSPLS